MGFWIVGADAIGVGELVKCGRVKTRVLEEKDKKVSSCIEMKTNEESKVF